MEKLGVFRGDLVRIGTFAGDICAQAARLKAKASAPTEPALCERRALMKYIVKPAAQRNFRAYLKQSVEYRQSSDS
jgi:hypothetical protein